jgi:hypothetical protein
MLKNTKILWCALLLTVLMGSLPLWAGTIVWGYGTTRSEAVDDTERKARDLARQKGTCYEHVRPGSCRQDGGEWACSTDVANHKGSCGGGDKVRP